MIPLGQTPPGLAASTEPAPLGVSLRPRLTFFVCVPLQLLVPVVACARQKQPWPLVGVFAFAARVIIVGVVLAPVVDASYLQTQLQQQKPADARSAFFFFSSASSSVTTAFFLGISPLNRGRMSTMGSPNFGSSIILGSSSNLTVSSSSFGGGGMGGGWRELGRLGQSDFLHDGTTNTSTSTSTSVVISRQDLIGQCNKVVHGTSDFLPRFSHRLLRVLPPRVLHRLLRV